MREIHQGLPYKDFIRPVSGIVDVTVCAKSGLLKTSACNEGEITLPFLEGTQPEQYCTVHGNAGSIRTTIQRFETDTLFLDNGELLNNLPMPTLAPEFMRELNSSSSSNSSRRNTGANRNTYSLSPRTNSGLQDTPESVPDYGLELPNYNPLLE
jgi:penicillin-binding protein 1A